MFIVIDSVTGKARIATVQEQLAYQEEFIDLQREDLIQSINEARSKITNPTGEFSDVSNYTLLELADVLMEHEYELLDQG